MPSLNKSTAAAALLLAFAPLTVPDMAAAAEATAETAPVDGDVAAPVDEMPEQPSVDPEPAPEPAEDLSPTPAPVVEPSAPETAPAPTPSPNPSPTASAPSPSPTAEPTPDEVTPNETQIDVWVYGGPDTPGQPGENVTVSTLNVRNASTISIPSRTLDYHWTLAGPGHFRSSNRPFAVTYSGSPNVANCVLTDPQRWDCLGGNPTTLTTGTANFNHIRTQVFIDDDALPGDVVTLTGWVEPNASTDYVNTAEVTSTTWKTWVPLTAAVIDEPAAAVGPKPTITGQGVPGGTIDVTVGDQPLVTVPVEDDGRWSLPVTEALPDGSVAVTAVQHRNGFTAEPATTTLDIDATGPEAPVVDAPGTLIDPTGPITGTAEPGSVIIVRDRDDNELGRDTANDDGSFSVRLDNPLPEGDSELVVVASDEFDNESDATTVTATVPDTTAPGAPEVEDRQELATSTGPIVGTAEPGATVIIRDQDGNELGRGEAEDDGQFRVELDEPLVEGAHDLVVVAQDEAGNESAAAPVTVIAPDVTAPDAPISTTPEFLADATGPFTGSAEPGATVIVRDQDGNELGRGEAEDDGQFRIVLDEPLEDGAHELVIVAEDAAGNVSPPTPISVDVDDDAPDAPVVTSPADLADGKGPITGTAEPGTIVIVRDEDGQEIGRGEANDDGDFSIELDEPLYDGKHDLEVIAADKAGNISTPTPIVVDIDTEAPDGPVITSPVDLADGKGPITGTAEPGAVVIIRDEDGNELGRGEANDDGDFSIELDEPLQDGSHDLVVIVEDKAGNESDPIDTTVIIDTEAPDAPVVTSPADLADGQGPITGTAEPGAVVIIRDEDGNELGRGEANDDGDFSIELDEPLADGHHDLVVVAKDKAGNVSDHTDTTVIIDTDAPNAPLVTSPTDLADGQGPITGTAEPGTIVIIRDEDGNELGRGEANDDGDWSIELDEPLKDGSHQLEVVVEDKAGNESDPTKTTVDIDTIAPKTPGLEAFDDIVDGTGVVRGTAEPGTTVIIRDSDGREIGRGTAGADGRFAFRTTVPLDPGAHLLSVVAVDRVGNVSPGGSMLVTLVPESEDEDESEIALPVIAAPGIAQPSAPATGGALAGPAAQNTSATSGALKGTGSGELAFTGAELGGWLAAALAALGLGAALRFLTRRRERDVRGD